MPRIRRVLEFDVAVDTVEHALGPEFFEASIEIGPRLTKIRVAVVAQSEYGKAQPFQAWRSLAKEETVKLDRRVRRVAFTLRA